MTLMLGLSLAFTTAAVTFAQEKKEEDTSKKEGGAQNAQGRPVYLRRANDNPSGAIRGTKALRVQARPRIRLAPERKRLPPAKVGSGGHPVPPAAHRGAGS
jgi:hypothetical protein